jgi:hypothetical protein
MRRRQRRVALALLLLLLLLLQGMLRELLWGGGCVVMGLLGERWRCHR